MTSTVHLRVGDLSSSEFTARLTGPGLGVSLGPFDTLLNVNSARLYAPLHLLYAEYPLLGGERVYSLRVRLDDAWRLRPRPAPMVRFSADRLPLHEDLPREQGLAVLEWGINLVIALRFHCYLILHTAVVERNGLALVLPAAPGYGKSTLCAALVHRGWRLLSDEFGLVRPGTTAFIPVPRPMPLKNESIGVIRSFAPEAVIGPEIPGTRKGTVAHVRPQQESILRAEETVEPAWLVFPRWESGVRLTMDEVRPSEGFMRLATNAFNYDRHGELGFTSIRDIVAQTRSFRLTYSNLDEAVAVFDRLADGAHG